MSEDMRERIARLEAERDEEAQKLVKAQEDIQRAIAESARAQSKARIAYKHELEKMRSEFEAIRISIPEGRLARPAAVAMEPEHDRPYEGDSLHPLSFEAKYRDQRPLCLYTGLGAGQINYYIDSDRWRVGNESVSRSELLDRYRDLLAYWVVHHYPSAVAAEVKAAAKVKDSVGARTNQPKGWLKIAFAILLLIGAVVTLVVLNAGG